MKPATAFSLLLVAASLACAEAHTYYVAADGSDSYNGTSAMPFLTLSKALDSSQSGDTIVVGEGEYSGPDNTGLTFSDRTITSDGEDVTFVGSGPGAVWEVSGDVELDSLTIQCDGLASQTTGIQLDGSFHSDRLAVNGCDVGVDFSLSTTAVYFSYADFTDTEFGIVGTSGDNYALAKLSIHDSTFRCTLYAIPLLVFQCHILPDR